MEILVFSLLFSTKIGNVLCLLFSRMGLHTQRYLFENDPSCELSETWLEWHQLELQRCLFRYILPYSFVHFRAIHNIVYNGK